MPVRENGKTILLTSTKWSSTGGSRARVRMEKLAGIALPPVDIRAAHFQNF